MRDAVIGRIFIWLFRHARSLVLIAAILAVAGVLRESVTEYRRDVGELGNLEALYKHFVEVRGKLTRDLTERMKQAGQDSEAQLDSRIAKVGAEVSELGRIAAQEKGGIGGVIGFGSPKYYEVKLREELLRQELEHLKSLKQALQASKGIEANKRELQRLQSLQAPLVLEARKAYEEHQRLRETSPIECRLVGTTCYRKLGDLRALIELRNGEVLGLSKDIQKVINSVETLERIRAANSRAFKIAEGKLDEVIGRLPEEIAKRQRELGNHWMDYAWRRIADVLPTALGIIVGVITTPIAIKCFFYFIMAPAASRRAPIRLVAQNERTEAGQAINQTSPNALLSPSAVSQSVVLKPSWVLLSLPTFIQSVAAGARKRTRWLLDRSRPFTSIAAGAVELIEITTDEETTVVLSSNTDPLAELAVMAIEPGKPIVLFPRYIAAIIEHEPRGLKIRSKTRFFSVHAWLTMQFRYLIFSGNATLILRGLRGVRVEPADRGRLVNQNMTIGFSADLQYSVVRCETFVSYLSGEDSLFNDRFSGDGFCIYEEVPSSRRAAGVTGKSLEAITDTLLKACGI